MIGVSLPPKYLLEGKVYNEKPEVLLPRLYQMGVRSVEIRDAKPGTDPQLVWDCAEILWDYNFQITIHCRVKSVETAVNDVFDTLMLTLRQLRQERLTVVIHPIVADNVEILRRLSDFAIQNELPVMIALENNRLLPGSIEGDSTELVLKAVAEVDRPNVGICFDMGHYHYYLKKNQPDHLDMLPPPEFFKRVVHTHIHAVNGLQTHFPLDQFELPLKQTLQVQSVGYYGVHNIELSPNRYADLREGVDALVGSVKALKEALPERALVYEELREHYDRLFLDAVAVLKDNRPGTRMALTQCASYLFNTNGLPWAMDVSFLTFMRKLTKAPRYAAQLLQDLRLMILTHKHGDHFDKKLIKQLAENKNLTWIIPEFLKEQAMELGVQEDKIITPIPGETIQFEGLTILPFEGRHFRHGTKSGVPCCGYHISAEGAPSLVFPGDVRDYSTEGLPQLPPADYCFAHVWLGDGNEFDEEFPMAEEFSRFMLHFSQKNILLSHLYNSERKLGYAWTLRHANILAEKIREISPETKTRVPRLGQIMPL